jgi:tRNA threonylcarbamoyladenosine biosynthesis protein TsaB
MIICLETATNVCSVALCNSAGVISLRESDEPKSHAAMLTGFIEDMLKENGIRARDLDAIAVSKGPGSYTGLRIGVSVAKGVAYAASIPLIGIETTLSMFYGMHSILKEKKLSINTSLYCPMLDARRMEVYYALYDSSGNIIKDISAEIVDENFFADIPEKENIIVFGDGSDKCASVIKNHNVVLSEDFRISAAHMHIPVIKAFNNNRHEDVAYFEPFYLKDFITTIPRKNIHGK